MDISPGKNIPENEKEIGGLIFFNASGVGLSPLYRSNFLLIVPAPDDR
jgi:hypothetical protein